MYNPTDWSRIFMNDLPFSFLGEVVLRSTIMFVVILVTLRASGKRGIKQLSVLELVLIIGLGSAAGDPMFYDDVGILPAITVFAVVIALYLAVTRMADKMKPVEKLLEGEPAYIISDGKILADAFEKLGISQDELFAQLRALNVEHLGQVKTGLMETSGQLSVLFFPDEEVKPGLPIFPLPLTTKQKNITETGLFACSGCGKTEQLQKNTSAICPDCDNKEWVKPIQTKRIA